MGAEQGVLERMGLETEEVSGGCCGLAGSWGFERGKHDISIDCGEQALLPAVRDAAADTVIVADGFSCKTQIEQAGTGRRALHVAQVIKLARDGARKGTAGHPEDAGPLNRPAAPWSLRLTRGAAVAGALALAGATIARSARSRV